jgi:hypothetical protein
MYRYVPEYRLTRPAASAPDEPATATCAAQ